MTPNPTLFIHIKNRASVNMNTRKHDMTGEQNRTILEKWM